MASPTTVLERRCRMLLRAYPPAYRAQWGEEIVSTLLDATAPGRRGPSLGDAVDLLGNGLRRRWGLVGIAGFDAGLALAAPIAVALAAGIAGFAWWRVEPVSESVYRGHSMLFGVFRTLGPIAYALWLAAAVGWVVLRPTYRRALIGVAVAVTVALPVIAPLTTVDRPPLWVVMALSVFGLLAFVGAGSSQSTVDARLMVPAGAAGIAFGASTVTSLTASADPAAAYYYQPTIARVGTVVTATVAILAAVAVVRQLRQRGSAAWLWAAALLGLPAGWLGPFDVGPAVAGEIVPHFGRLAQVLLATSVASGTLAWLARRSVAGPAALRTAGIGAFGAAAGLGSFLALSQTGLLFSGPAAGLPWPALAPVVALAVAGLVALGGASTAGTSSGTDGDDWRGDGSVAGAGGGDSAGVGWRGDGSVAGAGGRSLGRTAGIGCAIAVGTLAAAWLVAVYDNEWAVSGWTNPGRTAILVVTIALLPFSACVHVAARILVGRSRDRRTLIAASAVLLISLGLIGYAVLPYLSAWAPMLLALVLCWVAAALPARRMQDLKS